MTGLHDLMLDDRPMAVFDLDGCLSQNPYHDARTRGPAPDFDWHSHWTDEGLLAHPEMVALAHALREAGWCVVVLTARPARYVRETAEWLGRQGFPRVFAIHETRRYVHGDGGEDEDLPLIMYGGDVPTHSGPWKAGVVGALIRGGADVRLAVDDYKPNAEALRSVVPVLLYERRR